jgi:uncharacterized protein YdaU (DUF1376 family)
VIAFYRHHIADWMDGTEDLDAEAYRTYHVIVQLIYLNEGPIANNERGIAGRCRQSLKTYRTAFKRLLDLGKVIIDDEARIRNARAVLELENIDEQRMRASRGGKSASGAAKVRSKPLKTQDAPQADAKDVASEREKRREEKNPARASRLPDGWKPQQEDIDEAKRVLGANASREFQKFRDYWKAQPGQRGVKLDWDATWRNWVRKAAENGQHGKAQRGGSLLDAIDRAIEKTEADLGEEQDSLLRLPRGPIRE